MLVGSARSSTLRGNSPSRAGALEEALKSGHGHAEHFSGAGDGQTEHVTEDEGGPLPGWEELEPGYQREADAVAGLHHIRRVAPLIDDQVVGDRLEPMQTRGRRPRRRQGFERRRPEPRWQGSPAATVQCCQAHIGGDTVQPRPKGRALLEAAEPLPGADIGFLHHVLGLVHRPCHPVTVSEQFLAIGRGRRLEPVGLHFGYGHNRSDSAVGRKESVRRDSLVAAGESVRA